MFIVCAKILIRKTPYPIKLSTWFFRAAKIYFLIKKAAIFKSKMQGFLSVEILTI